MQNKKKKIAFVSDAVYPYNKGGKEKRLYDITTRLAKDGHNITIYCMKWWDGPNSIKQDGVTLYAISPYYKLYVDGRRSIYQAILFSLHCFKLMRRDFDIIDIDHIPHPTIFTTKIVCLLRRKKMIVTWHEVWGRKYWKSYLGIAGIGGAIIEKMSALLPDSILSVSEHTTSDLKNILGINENKIVTIPNGLDFEKIKNIAPANNNSDLIFAGRLLSHKHVDILIEAVAILSRKMPDIKLIIVGDGPEKKNLEKLTLELGIEKNVEFLGFIDDHNEVYSIMHASKVFVLPSTREGFGIMVIEANACGLPVITINDAHNAARDLIINNENGLLCSLDKEKVADSIEKMLLTRKNPEHYPEYVKKYDMKFIMNKINNFYKLDQELTDEIKPSLILENSVLVSVVILTYNSEKTIGGVLEAVFKQKFNNYEIICIDSSSTDKTIEIINSYPIKLITISPKDFGHGKTRNFAAKNAKGEFIIFLTHDSVPKNENWLSEMIKPFDDLSVAGVYGRQIPRSDEEILDKHFQLSLYGRKEIIWEGDNWKQGDNIFSDANSAVRRNMIYQYPYIDDIIVSEDYEWAGRILKMGYKIVYSVTAKVIHSHSYKLAELFRRNFDVGVSYKSINMTGNMGSFVSKGLRILNQEIEYLYNSGHIKLIPFAILRDLVRFVAIQLGKNEKFFSKKFKLKYLSAQKWYWK